MSSRTWRQKAAVIIHERFTSIKAAQPTVPDEQILRMVSLHYYPWGERKNWVYQAWLGAMKDYRNALRLPPTKREAAKELSLFPVE